MSCEDCGLCGQPVVVPRGNVHARLMIIGEAPGKEEAETGRPFVGMSGQELSGYLKRAGINERQVFICNTVYCWPPKNRVPKPSELKCCRQNLDDNIDLVKPEIIVTLGKTATEAILGGDVKMDAVRGVPVRMGNGTVVVPSFHPAYALRSTQYMTHIQSDFDLVANILRAGGASRERLAPASTEVILAQSLDDVTSNINNSLVAVDTEWANNKPWCLSFCAGGPGVVVMAEDVRLLEEVNAHLSKPDVTTILHNALYDIKVLEQLGVYPSRVEDTIIMAHLLQDEPKSLKSLAIRHLGLDMHEYDDVTSPASDDRAAQYLYKVTGIEWPEVDPIETIVKGAIKRRQPQNIGKRAQKILDDYAKKKCSPYKRWKLIDLAEGRQLVEQSMGKMPRGELSDVDPNVAVKYAGTDAIATYHIYPRLAERIKKAKLLNAFDLDMSTVKMISDMQDRGILLDKDKLKEVSSGLRKEMDDALVSLEIHHRKVNPNSPKDVAKYLHETGIFIRPTQSTESKYLQKYVEKSVEVRMILKYRVAAKLLSTYIDALPYKADTNNRIHTRYSMTTTLTGRLSSSDPNLQNIPTRTEAGKAIRRSFVPMPGCQFLGMDYSQIEVRLAAHESQDKLLVRLLKEGADIHSETSQRIFGDTEKEHRYAAKRVGFGILYGISAKGLSEQIGWGEAECQDLIDDWFGVYGGVKIWIDQVKEETLKTGIARDWNGRYRLIPEIHSVHRRIREEGFRYAVNAKIQVGAGSILKRAIADLTPVYIDMQKSGFPVYPLLQIHDELVWEVGEEHVDYVQHVFKGIMENCVKLRVPLVVDAHTATNWGELK